MDHGDRDPWPKAAVEVALTRARGDEGSGDEPRRRRGGRGGPRPREANGGDGVGVGGGGDKGTSGGRRGVRICRERIKSTGTIAPDDLDLGWVILHREAKRVKFNGTPIITSKTACGNKALNNLRRNENIVKHKGRIGSVPDGACRRRGREHLLHKSRGDGAVEPAEDDAVHLCPVGVIRARYVGEDMIGEGVFSKRDEEKALPAGVVVGVEVEGDGDERLHVEDGDGLAVEVGDGFGVERRRWCGGVERRRLRGGVLRGGGRRRGDAETGEKRQDLGGKLRRGSRSGSRRRRDGGRRRRSHRRNRWRHRGGDGVIGGRSRRKETEENRGKGRSGRGRGTIGSGASDGGGQGVVVLTRGSLEGGADGVGDDFNGVIKDGVNSEGGGRSHGGGRVRRPAAGVERRWKREGT
uniref:OSJNBa0079F16.10 protein n=1 Tax=Oryza sativa subsp. japonica TaxID=39947 RepID=Q7XX05_ORYSJ|nr:OSJNBa0079F16.10 [Oryza sativa Japonica Group]